MSIRADSLIPLIQVFILKTANYPGSLQCTGHIAVSTRTSVTLSPAAPTQCLYVMTYSTGVRLKAPTVKSQIEILL